MPDDLFGQAAQVGRDDEFVMIGAQQIRGNARMPQFVELGFAAADGTF